ncbi:MAG: DNA polymerase III subunit beta, partial [Chlamydiia bacterium]|nr:DNA polymerase III subunit beta [Chlamydiia bacterium]
MKFIIAKSELSNLISSIQNVVAQKPTIPILSNFLIEAEGNELIITATDLTVGMRCRTDAKVIEEGATTLPAKCFSQLVRELTAASIEVGANPSEVTSILADSSSFKLHGLARDEFPALPDLTGAAQFRLDQSVLKDMLYRTSFAVSREDNRFVLTGVLLKIADGEATFVGTDGKRLSKARTSIEIDPAFAGEYIIPLKAVDEVYKNLRDEGLATVYLMNDKVAFEANHMIIIAKLLQGDYPDFNRVIPQSSDINVVLHREELTTLLRQISLFTSETSHSVRFSFAEGELVLTANTTDVGEGKVSMPVDYSGEPLAIAFNPGFFLDILRHVKTESVNLGITDS